MIFAKIIIGGKMGVEYYVFKLTKEYDCKANKENDVLYYYWVGGTSTGDLYEYEYQKLAERLLTNLKIIDDTVMGLLELKEKELDILNKLRIETIKNDLFITICDILGDEINGWKILKMIFTFGKNIKFITHDIFLKDIQYNQWYLASEFEFYPLLDECEKKGVKVVRCEL